MQKVKHRLEDYRRRREVVGQGKGGAEKETRPAEGVSLRLDSTDGTRLQTSRDQPRAQNPDPESSSGRASTSSTRSLCGCSTVLKLLLWAILWGFFIEVGFGAVYLVSSLLFLMVVSLRGSRRKQGEPSAYSVFNADCQPIQGTLSAEQFERELRYGPLSVK